MRSPYVRSINTVIHVFFICLFLSGSAFVYSVNVSPTVRKEAVIAAERIGYTKVSIGGFKYNGCNDRSMVRLSFKGNALNGADVTGTVCGGLFDRNFHITLD